MVKLRCKNGCRNGGGNPYCRIRKCCQKKKIVGCWLCTDYQKCIKLDELNENHGVAHIKNLRIIERKGADGFLDGKKHWYVKSK